MAASQTFQSDSNVVFERTKKTFNMWDENAENNMEISEEELSLEEKEKCEDENVEIAIKKKKHYYLYIQMEFCEGQTLREAITNMTLDENCKWDIISSLIDVINYIHEHKLIHRDIKPSNIFLDKDIL